MPLFRLLGTLTVLALLAACKSPPPTDAPRLPELELLETTEGAPFEVNLGATGGTPPLFHALEKVPPGFSFYTGPGLLKGPASASGQYAFTVQARDAQGAVDTKTYQLLVQPPLVIGTTPLPVASFGTRYEHRLQANGGKAPVSWTLASGTLPPGITLGEDGLLSGLPQERGTHAFTVRARDVHGAQATKALTLEARGTLADSGTPGGNTDGGTSDGGTSDGGTGDAGTGLSFSLANWNIEWFGDTANGPTDEVKQLDNVQTVIAGAGLDFWGLAELVDTTAFNTLKQRLPGYDGFLSNDSSIPYGSSYYSTYEQKVGILYRTDVVTVKSAQLILTESEQYFAFRPPLRVDLRLTRDGTSVDLVAIVLHMKALTDTSSYGRRKDAALVLKNYLDTQLPNERVIVLGDWNDDVDVSIVWDSASSSYLPTPYQNFLDAPADYTFVTQPLSIARQRSTVSFPDFIDHQLYSNELAANYVSGSAQVLKPNIYQYGNTTSDHYPVLSRFSFDAEPPPPPPPAASPVFINEFLPHPYDNPATGAPDYDQQFVELFNSGTEAVDISGWQLNDDKSYSGLEPTRHVFPPGTLLAPGKAYVVYSGPSAFPSDATNTAYASGFDGLRFNRGKNQGSSGDTVFLQRADGTLVDSHHYDNTYPGISYNSSPDMSRMDSFVRHDVLVPGTVSSPGLRAEGSAF
ncbi:MAG TPA: lamin tail domain-containing protein [Archangium sp.]|jgi:hypothetical protein|uniref:lamin tail domain-containing protein n=1 Tax=Archangium sp. TaxID=1872627 RepID=UPI002ED8155D